MFEFWWCGSGCEDPFLSLSLSLFRVLGVPRVCQDPSNDLAPFDDLEVSERSVSWEEVGADEGMGVAVRRAEDMSCSASRSRFSRTWSMVGGTWEVGSLIQGAVEDVKEGVSLGACCNSACSEAAVRRRFGSEVCAFLYFVG
jgi:hypothetical protein